MQRLGRGGRTFRAIVLQFAQRIRLEHFEEKWTPAFRPEMRENKELECFGDLKKSQNALMNNRE